jgi:hypothetical protein
MLQKRPWAAWTLLLVAGGILERQALQIPDGNSTFSCYTRSLFRTHTTEGRIAFLLSWGALTAWYIPHILKPNRNTSL